MLCAATPTKEETLVQKWIVGLVVCAVTALFATLAIADKKYGPGASDTEILLGQTMPYSGPVSAAGVIGKAMDAYFAKINSEGGVNGRKIRLLSRDDAYSPPKTVEQTRRLVEQDAVLAIVGNVGTATNGAIQKYLNNNHVPQLFISSGFQPDPTKSPWTMGWLPTYASEARIYANYILNNRPNAKIAILFQQDDFGRDSLKAFVDALGARADTMIVSKLSYHVTEPTVESQLVSLRSSGADVFFSISTHKFTSQAIRKVHELGWDPLMLIPSVSSSIEAVLKPAGLANATGTIAALLQKDPVDPAWDSDQGKRDWLSWMEKYYPNGDRADRGNVAGYTIAQLVVEVLKLCGDDLTRENVMKQAASLRGVQFPMILPGITANTDSTDYQPFKKLQLHRFDGRSWKPLSPPAED